ncbi:MAG TPA: SPASM domain-containing protein, partial [Fibrobacteraceae bacterium]|nr:SPASM domain-containing protein [Fibrobacteraceae bacterium]
PNPPCAALAGHMRLYPDGSVPVCQFNSQTVGNLVQHDFKTCWESESVLAWRSWVKRCVGCWAECEILPNAFLSGDLWWQSTPLSNLGLVPERAMRGQ